MLKETYALEILRQKIEKAEFEAGDSSDFIDRGNPNQRQLEAAQQLIAKKMSEAAVYKKELHEFLEQCSKESVVEWVNWHKNILKEILLKPVLNSNDKTRAFTARNTLTDWEKVLTREKDYVNINWYFLKDYKEKAEKEFKGSGNVQ